MIYVLICAYYSLLSFLLVNQVHDPEDDEQRQEEGDRRVHVPEEEPRGENTG